MPVAGILAQLAPKVPWAAAIGDPLAGFCSAALWFAALWFAALWFAAPGAGPLWLGVGPADDGPPDPQPTAASPAPATTATRMPRDLTTHLPLARHEEY
jgi:hypothetical protein